MRASSLVVAHASTTLVEALLLGVPAAFYKCAGPAAAPTPGGPALPLLPPTFLSLATTSP